MWGIQSKCSNWQNSVFLRHSVCIAFNKSSLFSNQQLDLGLIQCHPKPSIWLWTFCSESLHIFSLWNTICPIVLDFFGSQQMSAYQFDLGQFQCHPKPPIWLQPPLPYPSFYSSLLFFVQTHLRRLFLHGTICSAPTNLAVSPGGVTAACFAIISDNILQPLFVRQVLTGISFPPIGRKNDIFEYFKLNRWKDAVDAVDACRGASRPFE